MATILFFGFLIGMRHALEADHVAAVATLASRSSSLRQSLRLGAIWGLGHSATLFAVGGAVLLADAVVSTEVARWLEGLVGVMLIFLGADVIRRMLRDRVHFHFHRHGSVLHFHAHSHRDGRQHDNSAHEHEHLRGLTGRALVVGLIHGLAGTAALVLLTLEAMESFWMGVDSRHGSPVMYHRAAVAAGRRSRDLGLSWPDGSPRPLHRWPGLQNLDCVVCSLSRERAGCGSARLDGDPQERSAFRQN